VRDRAEAAAVALIPEFRLHTAICQLTTSMLMFPIGLVRIVTLSPVTISLRSQTRRGELTVYIECDMFSKRPNQTPSLCAKCPQHDYW
jgi:hypothetical protein